jgi:serpin B
LHLSLTSAGVAVANAKLIANLKTASGQDAVALDTANALVEVKPHIVDTGYRNLLERAFAAEAFPGDVEAINRWIADKTSGKIPHMLNSLPDDTGMVLANAAYFKAFWQYPFDKRATEDGAFHLTSTGDAQVKMMREEDHFAVVKGADFKAIRLPYRSVDQRLAMIVVIPHAVDELATLIEELSPERIEKLRADLATADLPDVQLQLPRFHAAYQASLAAPLAKAGMAPAFDLDKADFRGMTGRPPADLRIAIGDVIHSAVIDVNEESSEAAAATVVEMPATAMAHQYEPPPEPFIVDRPFLFFIVDDGTGTVLFQGRIVDPRS